MFTMVIAFKKDWRVMISLGLRSSSSRRFKYFAALKHSCAFSKARKAKGCRTACYVVAHLDI